MKKKMKTESYYKKDRNEIIEFIPKNYNKILEIGCSEGNFRKNLSPNCEYWGVETNLESGRIASKKINKLIKGDFFKIHNQLPDNYFDLVICNDVIEHFEDYNLFFDTIRKKMTDNAFIIGSIPNVRYVTNLYNLIFLKNWEYTNEGILDKTHLRFFTKKTLIDTFSKNGFNIIQLDGINKISVSIFSLKSILKKLLTFIFGRDSNYLQFGFCLKKINN